MFMMNDNPLVSIIVPVYNVEPYLDEALESVIHQTYHNLEVLVIDDGSTDGSGTICDDFARRDERIRVIHQDNRGISSARNVGLDQMRGDVVAFLDPDDVYQIVFIEKLMNVMIKENADVVLCRYTVFSDTGMRCHKRMNSKPSGAAGVYDRVRGLNAFANREINTHVWNKLYRRALWSEIRFPDGHVYEDMETSFRMFDLCTKSCVIEDPLYLHRSRPGSITTTYSVENYRDFDLAYSRIVPFMESLVPEILTEVQVRQWRRNHLESMILSYIKVPRKLRDKGVFCEELRKIIIDVGRKNNAETHGFRTRVAWEMICSCPCLLRIAYALYRPLWRLVRMITRR